MVLSGPQNQIGGSQSVSPQVLRSNSGMLGAQNGFPSLVSPRAHFDHVNVLGGVTNMSSSLLNQSFGNGSLNPGISGSESSSHRGGGIDEPDPLSNVGNGVSFGSPPSSSFVPSNMVNAGPSSSQVQGQQAFQHGQQSMQQNQFHTMRGGGSGAAGPVKMEQKMTNDQHGAHQQQQQLRNLGSVKLEPQQMQATRNLPPLKSEPQQHSSDQSLYLQQQQQQFLQMSRQSSQSAAAQFNLLHQQRLLQIQQQHQQQQLLKATPQQRSQLPNLPQRSPAKPVYEPGMCARRLTRYMYQQQHRPEDNNIEFWRKFVAEYFAPNARKKWCVSMYGSGRQATGVFPQDVWHCEICNRKPGRGFEATVEVLPRLYKIKYESGTLEELLYVDMPHEYPNSSGQIVLDYAKAIQESVFDQLRVVRDGQLRIVFSPELKICSWEFCARRHEELIPRKLLIPQVSQLGAAAQKYQAATQNTSSNLSAQELLTNCNVFVSSARQLAKALEVPLVNDLGYTKRYVRCLQISEVVNSMKDLIDYSRETRTGPVESLAKYPRRTSGPAGSNGQGQQSDEQQALPQSSNGDPSSVQAVATQVAAGNDASTVNNAANSASTIAGLLHQNSMNSRQHSSMNNASSPYAGTSAQAPSPPGSSSTVPQPNPSPFQSPAPSSSSAPPPQTVHNNVDQGESRSSVQKLIHNMMMSNQRDNNNNNNNNANGILPTSNNAGNGPVNRSGIGGFGSVAMGSNNNSLMNGRMATAASMVREQKMNNHHHHHHHQQQDLSNQLLSGLGAVNGFNNLQFDWKPSP